MFSPAPIKRIDSTGKYVYRIMSSTGNKSLLGILAHGSTNLIARHVICCAVCILSAGRRPSAGRRLRNGGLADIAPTVLDLMGLPIPDEMTGRSLIVDA